MSIFLYIFTGNFPMNDKIDRTFALTCSTFGTVILILAICLFKIFRRKNNNTGKI